MCRFDSLITFGDKVVTRTPGDHGKGYELVCAGDGNCVAVTDTHELGDYRFTRKPSSAMRGSRPDGTSGLLANPCGPCVMVTICFVLVNEISTEIVSLAADVIQVWSAPGGMTRLPCDLAAPVSEVALMFWFKEGDRMPIYTVDFRNGPPVHWAVAGEFGTRTHFVLNESDPSSAHLVVEKVARQDEGVYRCRIDYVDAPTRNYRVNLTVIVPPEAPRIYDYEGTEILGSIAGPFREGQNVLLSCQAAGGKPAPDVSWYRGDERLAFTKEGSVCQLHLPNLSREMTGTKLQCRVEPPLLEPQFRDVTIRLYLKPQYIRVTGNGATRASMDKSFVCTTRGSKPAPNIEWFINSQLVEVDGEVTKSVLTWHVRREDSGRQLSCRVSNPWFPAHTLEDSVTLDVMYPPVTQISLIEPKEPRLLREDENAVLLCSADASPPAVNFTFYKGPEIPAANVTVMGSTSTVIHGLPSETDDDLGWLACWASNDVGNQREPCLFRILPAALPEPPSNCEIENDLLHCEPGHDGGLPQRFLLEALEVRHRTETAHEDNEISTMNDQGISAFGLTEAVYRVRNDKPQFALDALNPGRYTLLVYAETPRGRSQRPAALHSVSIRTADDLDRPGSLQTMTPAPPPQAPPTDNSVALLVGAALSLVLVTILTTLCVAMIVMCKKKSRPRDPEQSTILRRNVGVSMYGGSTISSNVVPTVVVRGHRGSRVLAARWSGVLDDAPLAVLALDTRPHDSDSSRSEDDIQETELTSNDVETHT
ncbi:unnamed protein product [Chrysodeixis includens]|uniref:Ig-like domain-containing protein n=1 Tax=Chrysodeixis includens TaxID=689277 RepID=A0A9N8KV17_CHRIL|nr:unnamed protein product [Chrysodeixis includens]